MTHPDNYITITRGFAIALVDLLKLAGPLLSAEMFREVIVAMGSGHNNEDTDVQEFSEHITTLAIEFERMRMMA